jgi:O-antigen/teichoic acid export membrane protein
VSELRGALGKLLKSAGIVFAGTVLARGFALGAEVAIIRSLSPGVFGTIAVAYTVALVLARLSLLGVPQGVTRFVAADDAVENQRAVVKHGLVLVAPVAVLAGGSLLVFPDRIGDLLNSRNVAPYLAFFALFVVVFPVTRVAIAVLRARGETARAVLSKDLLSRVGGLLLFAGAASVGAARTGAVAYWVSLPLISLAVATYFLGRGLGVGDVLSTTVDRSSLRDLWSFSWPLALSSSLILLFSNMDVLMIEFFSTAEAVGYYRSVRPLRQVTEFVLTSFVFLYLPLATRYFSNDRVDALAAFYKTSTKWVTSLTLPLVLVFAVFAEAVVVAFYGPTYLPAAGALTVLVGGLFFNVLVGPNGATAKAIDRPRIDLGAAVVGFLVNFGLNVALIPRFGIVGAAAATVLGYVTFNVVEVALIYRVIGSLPFSANQLKPLVPTVAVALLLERAVGQTPGLPGLVAIGAFLSLFHLGSMLATGSVDRNDLDVIRQVEGRLGREIPYLRRVVDRFSDG